MCYTAYTKIQHFIYVCSGTDKTAADPMTWGWAKTYKILRFSLYLFFYGLNSNLLTEAVWQEIWE